MSKIENSQRENTVYQNTKEGLFPRLSGEEMHALPRSTRWILAQPHIEQGEREWLYARKFAITASNCSEALHCSLMYFLRGVRPMERYQVVEHVLDQKAALIAPFEGNAATQFGTLHEPLAVRSCADRKQTDLILVGLLIHPKHRWLGASPDGVFRGHNGRLLEVKVPKSRSFKVGDPIPPHYWVQCQIQMEVTGAREVLYYEYRVPSTSKRARIKEPRINEVLVRRDRKWFKAALPLLAAFVEAMYRLRRLAALYDSRFLRREKRMARRDEN